MAMENPRFMVYGKNAMDFAKESSIYEFEDFPATLDDPRGIKEKSPSFSDPRCPQNLLFWSCNVPEKNGPEKQEIPWDTCQLIFSQLINKTVIY